MLQYDWSTAGVLNPVENSHRILPVIYCSEHETIVLVLQCQLYGLCKYTNILMCVNTSMFCVNLQIFGV